MNDQGIRRADYGLDAPGVVRNLLGIGSGCLLLALLIGMGVVPGMLHIPFFGGNTVNFGMLPTAIGTGISLVATGCYMVYTSRVGKIRERERILDNLAWSGNERVLDVGCGRGLLLIGAAKRLTTGSAVGADIWSNTDLAQNRPDATLNNARIEGVADRVTVETADMRKMPFDTGTFDVALSCAAIHNLYKASERADAIAEIARVLKPGGFALIDDIRHINEYEKVFEANGCQLEKRIDSAWSSGLWTILTFGSLRPGVILVRME